MRQQVQMGLMCSGLPPVLQHSTQHNAACHSHVGEDDGQPALPSAAAAAVMAASSFLYLPAHLGRFPAACPYVMAVQGPPRRMACVSRVKSPQVTSLRIMCRPFQAMRSPQMQSFLTENRGWGVRASQPIRKGTFIVEYAGEPVAADGCCSCCLVWGCSSQHIHASGQQSLGGALPIPAAACSVAACEALGPKSPQPGQSAGAWLPPQGCTPLLHSRVIVLVPVHTSEAPVLMPAS